MKSRRKILVEKIINILLNVLIFVFGIILLISIYTGVQTKILGNNYANFFGYSIFEVQTGSMADTINAGDCIIVKLTQKVKLDDIITYEAKGEYITHRIIEVYKGTYVTKGDANSAKDEPIDQKQVIGKTVNVWHNFGIIRRTLFNPSVLVALIVTLLLFNFAVKKNKKGDTKVQESDSKKEQKNYLDVITKKGRSLLEKIKTNINDKVLKKFKKKDKKIEKENNVSKTENKELIGLEPIYNIPKTDNLKENVSREDDLEKTLFYRVISVDSNEVDDRFKELAKKVVSEEYIEPEHKEEDIEKTSLYRMIPVDLSDIDNTRLEIAENELTTAQQDEKNKEKALNAQLKLEETAEIEDEATLTQITLDLLKNKKGKRKGKNIIDNAMIIKEEEMNELVDVLVEDDRSFVRKETVKDTLITSYLNARYYNNFGDNDTQHSSRKSISRMENLVKKVSTSLMSNKNSNDSKYKQTVTTYANTLILIANLEQARDLITDSRVKNEFYKKEISQYSEEWDRKKVEETVDKINKIHRKYTSVLDYFLRNLETNMFELHFNKLTIKDMYGLELIHNITFSKVYSDYIIDKTYTEGIIAEDKMTVLLTLLSIQLIKDMVLSDFNKKYVLYIPESLYTKEKKLDKILRIIDDEHARECVIILLTIEGLLKNSQVIKKVRKMGYKFALVLDEKTVIEGKDHGNIYIADYIFANKKIENMEKTISAIPEELLSKVIDEDIVDKVGDFGGEEE